jgi:hypothetical protein
MVEALKESPRILIVDDIDRILEALNQGWGNVWWNFQQNWDYYFVTILFHNNFYEYFITLYLARPKFSTKFYKSWI